MRLCRHRRQCQRGQPRHGELPVFPARRLPLLGPRIGWRDAPQLQRRRPQSESEYNARGLGRRIGEELGLPVFLYADCGEGRGPAFFRRGGTDELQRRIDAGEVTPDFGPMRLDPGSGAVIVGSRPPLIAFNVNLAGANIEAAREIARSTSAAGTSTSTLTREPGSSETVGSIERGTLEDRLGRRSSMQPTLTTPGWG